MAKLFLAVSTADGAVGLFGKSFRMASHEYLPRDEKSHRDKEQTPCIEIRDEQKRCEHHCEIPIVDAAGCAAFVLHIPRLEWAEKQNANHIAHRIEKADDEQNALVDDASEIKTADDGVEDKPFDSHDERALLCVEFDFANIGRHKITCKLLLASHALKLRREEAEHHFDSKNNPYNPHQHRHFQPFCEGRDGNLRRVYYI